MKSFLVVLMTIAAVAAVPSNNTLSARRIVGGGRIINGSPAARGQFPWQVAIYFDLGTGTAFCGGALIAPQWILTAGHCAADVAGPEAFSVYVGIVDLEAAGNALTVSQAIVHSGYDSFTLQHDVALLQLARPLILSPTVTAIPLAENELDSAIDVTVSGWGKTSDDSNTVSQTLNYVELVTISNQECDEYYGITYDSMVCAEAGNPVKSTCNGDSGGPLIVGEKNSAVHVGVVSFVSIYGCESGYPSGYTRTASYRDWIRENSGV